MNRTNEKICANIARELNSLRQLDFSGRSLQNKSQVYSPRFIKAIGLDAAYNLLHEMRTVYQNSDMITGG